MAANRNSLFPLDTLLNLRSPRIRSARASQQPVAKRVYGRPDQPKDCQGTDCLFEVDSIQRKALCYSATADS